MLEQQKLIQTALDGFLAVRVTDGRIIEANDAFCGMVGYSRQELLSMHLSDLEADETPAETAAHIKKVMDIGHDRFEARHRHKQGHLIDLEISVSHSELDGGTSFVFARDITERKHFERALRMREQEYRTLIENLPHMVVRYDTELRRTYVNPAWEKASGLSAGDVINIPVNSIPKVPQPAVNDYLEKLRKVLETGTLQSIEFAWVNAHGQNLFLDYTIVPELDQYGKIIGVLSVGRDLTERKRAEQERQAHSRALECMDSVNKAIQRASDLEQMMHDVLDVVLAFFDCDRAFLVYPCDPDAAEWRAPMECTRPEYPGVLVLGMAVPMDENVARIMRVALDTAGPVKFGPGAEYPLPPALSEQFGIQSQMLMAVHPRLDQPWQFGIHQCSHSRMWTRDEEVLFQKIGRRLSDALTSLSMYRSLQASEQNFRTLAENMPDNIVRYNREAVTVYINPVLERTLGDRAARKIGMTPREHHPDGAFEDYAQLLDSVLASGEARELEKILPGPGGETSIHQIRMVPERGESGEVVGVLAIGRDITELKQAEHQLRKLTAHLQTVREEEKAHLAREIHDELGSILLALRIETHLLNSGLSAEQKRMPLFGRVESMVDLLDDAIKATRSIINDLRPTVLDDLGLMAALEWQAVQFHKHTGIECQVACIFREANGCTDCKDCEYTLDKTLSINLFRIFQEALNNVARHSGASRVEAELQPTDHEIVLSISDNGSGLLEGHAFASSSYGIRGMRERVEHLSGKIEFAESPDGGLRVIVRLPLLAT